MRTIVSSMLVAWTLIEVPGAGAEPAAPDTFLRQLTLTRRFSAGVPNSHAITPAGDEVLFLRSGPRSNVHDLFAYDVSTRSERALLTANRILRGAEEHLSADEKARRERARQQARGIASFELSRDGRHLLVPLSGRLFVVERSSGRVRELESASGYPIDPRFSPDARQVACVREGDVYVTQVETGIERRLTHGANDTLSHGLAEFAAQEEMGRYEGYWWSPDGTILAIQETNVAGLETLHIADPVHPEQEPQSWPYPRAGRENADVRLGLLPAPGGSTTWVAWDRTRYPYLASVTWKENAPLTILVQNRRQTEQQLLAVDLATGGTRRLLAEADRAWLNLDDSVPHWLTDGSAFLWATERGGAWQLELRSRAGRLLRTLTTPSLAYRSLLAVDEQRRVAWVTGGEEPTERHLFRVPLDLARGRPEQVSTEPGIHGATFARDGAVGDLFVHMANPRSGTPSQTVQRWDGSVVGTLQSVAEIPPFGVNMEIVTLGTPHFMRALVVRPHDFDPARRYPVWVKVYGGPLSQTVVASALRYLTHQWTADQGFVVVSIDGRGTPSRGRAWERAIRGDLIGVPLRDQVAGLRELGRRYPELDMDRVGIQGWSFGGYFSAMAVMRHPELFRAAVAGAPVVDWEDYDTHYTERYMGLPAENAVGYRAASVLTHAARLSRPLLVIHGTDDDNVYFVHSMKLSDALFRAGKRFEFLPLSGFTHMVADPSTNERLERLQVDFMRRHLGTPGETRPSAGPDR